MVNVNDGVFSRQRLTPLDRTKDLLPWRRAHELTRCSLYWMPVSGFPMASGQRAWILEFLARVAKGIEADLGLRHEQFLQYKTVYPDLMNQLLNEMMELLPIMGLGRKPGAPLPQFPSAQEVERSAKRIFAQLKGGEPMDLPDPKKHMPDYSYWFLDKSHEHQRDLFFGYGGMTIAFMKRDQKAPPPLLISQAQMAKMPMFKSLNMEKALARGNSLNDPFLAKSKQLFGGGLEHEPQMKGVPFVLPIFDSADFFGQPEDVVKNCFEVFDIYVRESTVDKGLLLASSTDLDDRLIDLVIEMQRDGLIYTES
jgi:hypothetical protein